MSNNSTAEACLTNVSGRQGVLESTAAPSELVNHITSTERRYRIPVSPVGSRRAAL
jgi:hypothetical protein